MSDNHAETLAAESLLTSSAPQTLKKQLAEFSAHLRLPEDNKAPEGVEDRRMKIYRELFFNNIESFLAGAFPVYKSLFTEDEWLLIVRDFFARYPSKTPYFLEISESFLGYLEHTPLPLTQRFSFSQELCHYEWLELAVDIAGDEVAPVFDPNADLLSGSLVLSDAFQIGLYEWPVHEIGAANIPQAPSEQINCLVVYRDRHDSVQFMQTNPITVQLLALVQENPALETQQLITQLAQTIGFADIQALQTHARAALDQLQALGIVLGVTAL